MFVILKPDADIGLWLKRLIRYDLKIYRRKKTEEWVRMHYNHLTEDILLRNIDFFTTGYCLGVDVKIEDFYGLAKTLREARVIDPRFLHRNQIHVPDNPVNSEIEKVLFLDETTNR